MPDPDPLTLFSFITNSFGLEELKTLCFQLYVPFDDLPGEGREAKVRELIAYMRNRGRLPDLSAALARERPEKYAAAFGEEPRPPKRAEERLPDGFGADAAPSSPKVPLWGWLFGVAVLIALGILAATAFRGRSGDDLAQATSPAATLTAAISEHTPSPTPTATPSPTPTPKAGDIRTVARGDVAVEQVYVPAGSFMMGSSNGADDERPVHKVTLDAFWIDQTEVTNEQYEACVSAEVCEPPSNNSSDTRNIYFGNEDFADYPVIYVDWDDASEFCRWAEGRLPTEAEWEYAARGPDSLTFPWGEEQPTCDLLNYGFDCVGDTNETGAYSTGRSWVNALDMAGNVWEWVQDWYSGSYYKSSPENNPNGPETGDYRVMRGGAWGYADPFQIRSGYRNILNYPHFAGLGVGFRCAQE